MLKISRQNAKCQLKRITAVDNFFDGKKVDVEKVTVTNSFPKKPLGNVKETM